LSKCDSRSLHVIVGLYLNRTMCVIVSVILMDREWFGGWINEVD